MEEIIFEDYLRVLNSRSVEELKDIAVKYIEIVKEFQVAIKELKDQEN